MEHTILGLIKKRGEIAGQHKVAVKAADALKAHLDAIDRTLVLCGYQNVRDGAINDETTTISAKYLSFALIKQ